MGHSTRETGPGRISLFLILSCHDECMYDIAPVYLVYNVLPIPVPRYHFFNDALRLVVSRVLLSKGGARIPRVRFVMSQTRTRP